MKNPNDLYLIGYCAVRNDKRSVSNHKIVKGSIFESTATPQSDGELKRAINSPLTKVTQSRILYAIYAISYNGLNLGGNHGQNSNYSP